MQATCSTAVKPLFRVRHRPTKARTCAENRTTFHLNRSRVVLSIFLLLDPLSWYNINLVNLLIGLKMSTQIQSENWMGQTKLYWQLKLELDQVFRSLDMKSTESTWSQMKSGSIQWARIKDRSKYRTVLRVFR